MPRPQRGDECSQNRGQEKLILIFLTQGPGWVIMEVEMKTALDTTPSGVLTWDFSAPRTVNDELLVSITMVCKIVKDSNTD